MSLLKRSDSKPSKLQDFYFLVKSFYHKNITRLLIFITVLLIAAGSFHCYLSSWYNFDEVYHLNGPQDPLLPEQVTVRTIIPQSSSKLHDWLTVISGCPSVYRVQFIWLSDKEDPPTRQTIKYPSSHCDFDVLRILPTPGHDFFDEYFSPKMATESVLYLDADITLTCNDIRYAQSVWRSSQRSLVGAYPRRVTKEGDQFSYHSASSVAYHREYNLLLQSALFVSRQTLWDLNRSQYKNDLKIFLGESPECYDYVLPVFSPFMTRASPLWVEVNPIESSVALLKIPKASEFTMLYTSRDPLAFKKATKAKEYLTAAQRSECINRVSQILGGVELPMSYAKSTNAQNSWLW